MIEHMVNFEYTLDVSEYEGGITDTTTVENELRFNQHKSTALTGGERSNVLFIQKCSSCLRAHTRIKGECVCQGETLNSYRKIFTLFIPTAHWLNILAGDGPRQAVVVI